MCNVFMGTIFNTVNARPERGPWRARRPLPSFPYHNAIRRSGGPKLQQIHYSRWENRARIILRALASYCVTQALSILVSLSDCVLNARRVVHVHGALLPYQPHTSPLYLGTSWHQVEIMSIKSVSNPSQLSLKSLASLFQNPITLKPLSAPSQIGNVSISELRSWCLIIRNGYLQASGCTLNRQSMFLSQYTLLMTIQSELYIRFPKSHAHFASLRHRHLLYSIGASALSIFKRSSGSLFR